MDYITLILSSSSVGLVCLLIAGYIFKRCKKSECNAHISNTSGHFDISINKEVNPSEQKTNSSHKNEHIESPKCPEIV